MPRHAQNSRHPRTSTGSSGVFRRYHGVNDPFNFIDSMGLQIKWGNYVLINPNVIANLALLNQVIVESGIPDEAFTIKISGGDRHKSSTGCRMLVHKSSTDNSIVQNSHAQSPHLVENCARAVDFILEIDTRYEGNFSRDFVNWAVSKTQFRTHKPDEEGGPFNYYWVKQNYSNKHIHLSLPHRLKFP